MFGKRKETVRVEDNGISRVTVYAGFNRKSNSTMKPIPPEIFEIWFEEIEGLYKNMGFGVQVYHKYYGIKTVFERFMPKPYDAVKIEKLAKKRCKNYPHAACYYTFGDPFATYVLIVEYDGSTPS